uniref:receptor protein-tyrosine kinase n=1 Tax=Schmidtea mediterranea TaxID=79327 RepID=A0A1B1ACY8_SCHMD|nr:epidermal growth factor receptor Smed-egfr-6 [Schmidtea mediterranea]
MGLVIPALVLLLSLRAIKPNPNHHKEINGNDSLVKINVSNFDRQASEFNLKTNNASSDSFRRADSHSDHQNTCISKLVYEDIRDKPNNYMKVTANLNKNCTHVIGNVIITGITNENLSFLNSIEEITGFLFLFSNSVESISLKNLKIIRGENPWIYREVKFSLVVVSNIIGENMLKYLILPKFQVILQHNILVYNNPGMLYFKNNIHWNSILGKHQFLEIVEPHNSSNFTSKEIGDLSCHSSCQPHMGKRFCWGNSSGQCQIINDCVRKTCKLSSKCFLYGELKIEQCCHEECVGGCYGPLNTQCLICKHFNNQGACVEKCPRKLVHNGVKHIKNRLEKFTFHNTCVDKCPDKYFIENEKCVPKCKNGATYAVNETCLPCPNGVCPKDCLIKDVVQNYNIQYLNRKMLARLENCTVYHGNIIINTLSIEGDIGNGWPKNIYGIQGKDLEKLTNLKEIYGSLEINVGSKAPWLKTLLYFRNLEIIRAETTNNKHLTGLSINQNDDLVFLGLQELKEVRNGIVEIVNNPKLCYTDSLTNKSILHSNQMNIYNNGKDGKCEARKCSKLCHPKYGCWGPLGMFCVKCRHFQITEKNMCISNCSKQPGYFYNKENHQTHEMQCSKCHNQCLSSNITCYGPGADQCTFGCVNYKYNDYCTEKCPQDHYGDGSTSNICKACHQSCTKENLFSFKRTCTGPGNHIGVNGCRKCNYVQLLTNGSEGFISRFTVHSLTCIHSSNNCLDGYFKISLDFHSPENIMSLLKLYSNNSSLKMVLENWIDRQANHEYQFGAICLPCHPLCSQCSDGTIESCHRCKSHRRGKECVHNCYEDDYISKNSSNAESLCLKCHEECMEGCTGSTEYDCKQCKRVKIYLNSSKTKFFCNSICGDNFRIFVNSEMVCVQPQELKPIQNSWYIAAVGGSVVSVLAVGIVWKCICMSLNKRKRYDLKLKFPNGFSTVDIESDFAPSSTKLLPIAEGQPANEHILDLGKFCIMDKGTWTQKSNNTNCKKSCFKECLFKIIPDELVGLNVTIKVLSECSDLADNKDFLQKLKIITSTDPPWNLRIILVVVCAYSELSKQLTTTGSLIEFLKQNPSVVEDISILLWAHQVASGFGYIKYEGIINYDVETSNIKIESPLRIAISDSGLSKLSNTCNRMKKIKEGKLGIIWSLKENCNDQGFSSKSSVMTYNCNSDHDTRPNLRKLKQSIEMIMKNPCSFIILQINRDMSERQITVVNGLHSQIIYHVESSESKLQNEDLITTFNNHLEVPDESLRNPTSHHEDIVNNLILN